MTVPFSIVYLPVPPPTGEPQPGSPITPTDLIWAFKAPADVVPLMFDCTNFLYSQNNDQIDVSTVTISVIPNDVTVTNPVLSATQLMWTFSGGTITLPYYTAYSVEISFLTLGGLAISRTILLPVVPLGTQPGTGFVMLAIGPAGPSGTGIISVTQPDGPGTAVFTLLTPSTSSTFTQTITLPPGEQGDPGEPGSPGAPGPPGVAGATGGPGPSIQPYSIAGTWNATSNSPSLSAGGQGEAAQTALLVTTAGTTSLDGNSAWALGDIVLTTGAAWLKVPFSGSNGAFNSLIVGSNYTLAGVTSTVQGVLIGDNAGFVYVALGPNGVVSQAGTIANLTGTSLTYQSILALDNGSNTLLATDPVNSNTALPGMKVQAGNAFMLAIGDQRGFSPFLLDNQGRFWGTPGPGQAWLEGDGSTFSQTDYNQASDYGFAYSQAVAAATPSYVQAPQAGVSMALFTGASRSVAEQGVPPLLTTQPYPANVLMLGSTPQHASLTGQQMTHSNPTAIYDYVGALAFNPMIAVPMIQGGTTGGITTIPTGILTGITGMVVTGTSPGTFTWTGGPVISGTFIEPGLGIEFTGFGTLTNNNAPTTSGATFTVTSSGTRSIVVAESVQSGNDAGTISVCAINYQSFGGDHVVAMTTRRYSDWLSAGRNPAQKFVGACAGVSGAASADLAPGGAYWNMMPDAATKIAALALSSLGTNADLSAVVFDFGGPDGSNGVTSAQFTTNVESMVDSITNTICVGGSTILKQALPPPILLVATDGLQLVDGPDSNGVNMPITTAQAILAGCAPIQTGSVAPLRPNIFFATRHNGPSHTGHTTANTYLWEGLQIGKVHQRMMLNRVGHKAPHPVQILIRGTQWIVVFHSNGGVGQAVGTYIFTQPTLFSDWGFTVKDAAGNLTINSLAWVAPNVVGFTANRTTSFGATPVLWYSNQDTAPNGNANQHSGFGNIAFADPSYVPNKYSYTAGSGQAFGENLTASLSQLNTLQNGENFPMWEWCIPFAIKIPAASFV